MVTQDSITEALQSLIDPDVGKSLGELGSIERVELTAESVKVYCSLIPPLQWVARSLHQAIENKVKELSSTQTIEVFVSEKVIPRRGSTTVLPGVKAMVAVASGKGGVGKSTIAANLALALAQRGLAVGLLDADIYGPSQPIMFGLTGEVLEAHKDDKGRVIAFPKEAYGVKIASLGFVMQRDQAAILRGPMLAGYFKTLVEQIEWGDLDILVFDLPPGTGDIQLTLTQQIPLTGAVIVTTPQDIAVADVRRSISMFQKVNVDVLGIIENMSYFVPPDMPEKRYYIFGEGGGKEIALESGVPFLGELPLNQMVREGGDDGLPFVGNLESGMLADSFRDITEKVICEVRRANARGIQQAPLSIQL